MALVECGSPEEQKLLEKLNPINLSHQNLNDYVDWNFAFILGMTDIDKDYDYCQMIMGK